MSISSPDARAHRSEAATVATAGVPSEDDDVRRWVDSGLAALSGPADGPPLGPPRGFLRHLDALTDRIADSSAAVGRTVAVDGPTVLTERAKELGLRRRGQVSCGGGTHLVRADDGWLAVSLTRRDDVDLLPAWIGADVDGDPWEQVHESCGPRPLHDLIDRGVLLGLPVAELPSARAVPVGPGGDAAAGSTSPAPAVDSGRADDRSGPIRVVDLSSMWAGPLCGALLAAAGAHVTKVELLGRPDGARTGPPGLFARLNGEKHHVELDASTGGIDDLVRLIAASDVVIESSRPRALAQLGIDAAALLSQPSGPAVWVSITGHGRVAAAGNRVAFGDDAAVAGGLVVWDGDRPCFCADAVADPLTGLVAAAEALDALRDDRRVLLDVAMAAVAAGFAETTGALTA